MDLFDLGVETGVLTDDFPTVATDSGKLSVTAAAALVGNFGAQVVIDNATQKSAYRVITKQTTFQYRFLFKPNSPTMANADRFEIQRVLQSAGGFGVITLFHLDFTTVNNYRFVFDAQDDAGGLPVHDFSGSINAAVKHTLEVRMIRAATSVSADGSYQWWLNGVSEGLFTGIDNFNLMDDQNWRFYGVWVNGRDVGTSGTPYWDGWRANDDGSIIGNAIRKPFFTKHTSYFWSKTR